MNILLNGVGRVGKSILRIANGIQKLNIVAINELNPSIENITYNINYDSTYGRVDDKYFIDGNCIKNSKNKIEVLNYDHLSNINLKKFNIDVIVDASGAKLDIEKLKKLCVKHIVLTHPNNKAQKNIVLGVNDSQLHNDLKIISTSSCNATALLPVLKILNDNFQIEYGDVTTIHPLLNHQKTLDSGCVGSSDRDIKCNFEFGRSSTQNIIPSQTTTIDACSYVLDFISKENISSNSFRVPTSTVGAINVVMFLKEKVTMDSLMSILKKYENEQKNKILFNSFEPLVSSDFQKEEFTTIIDHRFTHVQNQKMVKLVLWYDNEWGYASKVVEILKKLTKV